MGPGEDEVTLVSTLSEKPKIDGRRRESSSLVQGGKVEEGHRRARTTLTEEQGRGDGDVWEESWKRVSRDSLEGGKDRGVPSRSPSGTFATSSFLEGTNMVYTDLPPSSPPPIPSLSSLHPSSSSPSFSPCSPMSFLSPSDPSSRTRPSTQPPPKPPSRTLKLIRLPQSDLSFFPARSSAPTSSRPSLESRPSPLSNSIPSPSSSSDALPNGISPYSSPSTSYGKQSPSMPHSQYATVSPSSSSRPSPSPSSSGTLKPKSSYSTLSSRLSSIFLSPAASPSTSSSTHQPATSSNPDLFPSTSTQSNRPTHPHRSVSQPRPPSFHELSPSKPSRLPPSRKPIHADWFSPSPSSPSSSTPVSRHILTELPKPKPPMVAGGASESTTIGRGDVKRRDLFGRAGGGGLAGVDGDGLRPG
jgi:hypothetical protein